MSLAALPLFVRLAGRPVILLGEGEPAEAKRRLLQRAGARIVGEDMPASLAIVALAEPDQAVARLRAHGVLVNAVDRPDLCDFTLPAIIDRAPVLLAIGTNGVSAGLAAALRQRLEALIPSTLGKLAEDLRAVRAEMRARWPDGAERRRALGAGLARQLDPLTEQPPGAVAQWLASASAPTPQLLRVTLRSGDPDDLTLREARMLALADRVFHRPSVPQAILNRTRADAVRIPCDALPTDTGDGIAVDLEYSA